MITRPLALTATTALLCLIAGTLVAPDVTQSPKFKEYPCRNDIGDPPLLGSVTPTKKRAHYSWSPKLSDPAELNEDDENEEELARGYRYHHLLT